MRSRRRPSRALALALAGALTASLAIPAAAAAAGNWAVVGSTGMLVRGSQVVSTARLGLGTYQAAFTSNISNCAYIASSGDTGAGAVAAPVEMTVARRSTNPAAVYVQAYDQTIPGVADEPFHLTLTCGATKTWAVVDDDGTFVRGGHEVSARRLGVGAYEVVFDHPVARCAYTAALGAPGTGAVQAPGVVTVAARAGNSSAVFVRTMDVPGANADLPFHLVVTCGAGNVLAVINADGSKARGANVVSSRKLSATANAGTYEVIFNRAVSACAFNAVAGPPGAGSVAAPVTVTTATRAGNPNGVFVFIHRTDGTTLDEPFHLVVRC